MQKIYQNIYIKFVCPPGSCTDSCCKGWDIVIDDDTFCNYSNLNNNYKNILNDNITKIDGDNCFKSTEGRCNFLNEKDLCNIILNIGEEYLCDTCRIYPRFIRSFGGRKEFGLSLSCPEVVKLFLDNDFNLITELDDEEPELCDIDADKFISLKKEREKLFKLTSIEEKAFDYSVLQKLDYIRNEIPGWLNNNKSRDTDISLVLKIFKYFVLKYYMDYLEEDNILNFIYFNTFALKRLIERSNESIEYTITRYCREIEHSQYNINLIKQNL